MTDLKVVSLYLSIALKVLSARLVLLLSLLLSFSLFAWCMANPTTNSIICATIFSIVVYLPAIRLDRAASKDRAVITPEES